ncbi:hypothetical protein SNE40_019523 [Patella caerulea]|uniref:Uncharacterized protein n=1 Tax=Patella caerulea TaxID=87958 RepID=A0AAN8J8N7_PATCE
MACLILLISCLMGLTTVIDAKPLKACVSKHGTYESGITFTTRRSGPCVKYTCHDGKVARISEGCEDHKEVCQPLGFEYEHNCSTMRCEVRDGRARFYVFRAGCKDYRGQCHDLKAKFPLHMEGYKYEGCSCDFIDNKFVYMCII